jgi:CheY-like chemotaxis protein
MLWRGVADAKGLKLRIEGASAMPRHVKGDVMRIRQVLNNLMSNAMKFTEQGQITLRVQAWPEEPSGYALLFEIVDTGPGMTSDQMARLFTPFDQTADGVSARYGGSGLGLAISRNLIDLMGGRLTVRSAPGQGSRFTVSLILPRGDEAAQIVEVVDESRLDIARSLTPSVAPTPQPASVAPSPAPEPEPVAATPAVAEEAEDQPLRLLVVDDHDINRRAVQLILQPLGCEITTAADGMIALERCQEAVFDVIFMDVRMPELDGRETARRRRTQCRDPGRRRHRRHRARGRRGLSGGRHGLFRLQAPDAARPDRRLAARPERHRRSGRDRGRLTPDGRDQTRGEIRLFHLAFPDDDHAPA